MKYESRPTRFRRALAVNTWDRPLMSIVRQERLLWTSLGLVTGAVSFIDVRVRPHAAFAGRPAVDPSPVFSVKLHIHPRASFASPTTTTRR